MYIFVYISIIIIYGLIYIIQHRGRTRTTATVYIIIRTSSVNTSANVNDESSIYFIYLFKKKHNTIYMYVGMYNICLMSTSRSGSWSGIY